jgi:hypothetical protein
MTTLRISIATLGAVVLTAAGIVVTSAPAFAAGTIDVPCTGPHGGGAGLAAAISAADSSALPTHILLAQGCTYLVSTELDVPDGGGLPAVVANVIISAPFSLPATTIRRLSAAPAFSLLNVDAPGSLTLSNVTVTGGLAVDGFAGGGIAIATGASAALLHCRVTGNAATYTTKFVAEGGGIYNNGALSLLGTRVDHNHVTDSAGDAIAIGGGIVNENFGPTVHATLTAKDSQVDHNTVDAGTGTFPGAVGAGLATLGNALTTLIDTAVTDNAATSAGPQAAALGGGLFDNLTFFTGFAQTSATVIGGTVSGNTVTTKGSGLAAGGGIYDAAGDVTTISRAAITGNRASGIGPFVLAQGGGVYTEPGASIMTLSATAITGDAAIASGGHSEADGGGLANAGSATIRQSLVAGNVAGSSGTGSAAHGGGIWTAATSPGGQLTVAAITAVTTNAARDTDGGTADGGGVYEDSGPVTISPLAIIRLNTPNNIAPLRRPDLPMSAGSGTGARPDPLMAGHRS